MDNRAIVTERNSESVRRLVLVQAKEPRDRKARKGLLIERTCDVPLEHRRDMPIARS